MVYYYQKGGIPMKYYTASTQLPPYIPYAKFLLDIPLSETARLVYSLILSRLNLSRSNGWVDAENRIYCRYTVQSLMEETGKSKTTIHGALKDLETHGLIHRRRCGAGCANHLYLRLPENCTSEVRNSVHKRSGKPNPNKYNNKIINYEYTGDSL